MTRPTRLSFLEELQKSTETDRWQEFVQVYGQWIRNWLVSQRIDSNDADDIQQEVMATVVAELPAFQHNQRTGAFRTWLRRITSNRLRRHWQHKQKLANSPEPGVPSVVEELEDSSSRLTLLWEKEHDQFVVNMLLERAENHFSHEAVDIFRKISLEQQSANDVAAEYDKTIGATRVIQHRVLKYVKEIGRGMLDA